MPTLLTENEEKRNRKKLKHIYSDLNFYSCFQFLSFRVSDTILFLMDSGFRGLAQQPYAYILNEKDEARIKIYTAAIELHKT